MSTDTDALLDEVAEPEYKYGFVTDIEADTIPPGLNEEVVRLISAKKKEPDWLLDWRLKAYRHWLTLEGPNSEPAGSRRTTFRWAGSLCETRSM